MRRVWISLGVLLLLQGCASRGRYPTGGEELRLSQVAGEDATRRASLRLCLDGLDDDAAGRPEAARGQYERAIQIDPTNPYVYLALARHEVDGGDPLRALEYVDQAETLLATEGSLTPGADAHVAGLRGTALREMGRSGDAQLEHARRLSPAVWGDGRLDSTELR